MIDDGGRLTYWQHKDGGLKILREPPHGDIYVRPSRHSVGYAMILRVENVLAREIEDAGGTLKLSDALARIAGLGLLARDMEAIVRLFVGNGTFVARVSGKRDTVRLSRSAIGRDRENYRSYASSFAHEIGMQAEQIGRLIGHGPAVGGQREELLRALLERHVPQRFHAATGFIEGSDRQIDILIYDQLDYAPLFHAGNLVVVPFEAVRAVIEVKSNLSSGELIDALRHLDEAIGGRRSGPPVFRGVFGYEGATVQTLISAIETHHSEPTSMADEGDPVFSIYEMAEAVCVLRRTILVSAFLNDDWNGRTAPRPAIIELASEAWRDTQAALFFDRLLRFLRHPFDGALIQPGLASRFAIDVAFASIKLLYHGRDWGPYVIDRGIDRVEAEIAAYQDWLDGKTRVEPPPSEE
ncbi:DUF6602 domain-containing protein [Novosphingobium sp.]|uniref:DUF6602 domain-containing protein n=1 Tax=Novosphingobium sp. TaxID=1874826 RepID=UPI002603534C|nr:DUF6602 domain-containing protein [Novosphingobium sp.]